MLRMNQWQLNRNLVLSLLPSLDLLVDPLDQFLNNGLLFFNVSLKEDLVRQVLEEMKILFEQNQKEV